MTAVTAVTEPHLCDLELCGLLALADPIRPTAGEAVQTLQRAGVEVMMITGDHPSTAESIAAELGVLDGREVVTGVELDAMDDTQLAADLPKVSVFARVSPAQKARIVRQLRRGERVVAVTGDGANDAPAIRLADVGIALGSRATPAAREAADVVVTDDRIETITDAIVEGRAMWSSVRDALSILLGGNLGEIGFTVAAGLLSAGDALNARQLLLVNLLTDVLPAMAVAVRPPGVTTEDLLCGGTRSFPRRSAHPGYVPSGGDHGRRSGVGLDVEPAGWHSRAGQYNRPGCSRGRAAGPNNCRAGPHAARRCCWRGISRRAGGSGADTRSEPLLRLPAAAGASVGHRPWICRGRHCCGSSLAVGELNVISSSLACQPAIPCCSPLPSIMGSPAVVSPTGEWFTMQDFFAAVLARLAAELIERLLLRLAQLLFAKPAVTLT